jgi:hypothetical protein
MKTLILLPILLLSGAAFGQKQQECWDLPEREFNRNLRFEAPAQLTDFSGGKIFFNIPTRNEIITGLSIEVDDKTIFPRGFEKDYKKGLWRIVFCADTGRVVIVNRIAGEEKIKFESKKEVETRLAKQQDKQ